MPTSFQVHKGTLLGTGKFRVKGFLDIPLEPGNRLVLYTDGLVESLPSDEKPDSYDKFQRYVQCHEFREIEGDCHSLVDRHPFFTTGEPQPDDFTVVIVERKTMYP